MKKLLSPSDWLLLVLGNVFDFVQEIRDPGGLFENYYVNFLGVENNRFSKRNFRQLVWRNLKTQNIEKTVENGEIVLKLTRQGRQKIDQRFPVTCLQKRGWDKKWRLVIYDIEETERSVRQKVRQKLKELGFGQFQRSVWISPHDFLKDLDEYFDELNLLDKIALIETENFFVEDVKEMADKLWKLDKLNNQYKKIVEQIYTLKTRLPSTSKVKQSVVSSADNKNDDDRTKKLDRLRFRVIKAYLSDPFLPKELLPSDWLGDKVRIRVKKIRLFETLSRLQF